MSLKKISLSLAFSAFCFGGVNAGQVLDDLSKALTKSMPGINIDSIKDTPIPGIYEVVSGGDIAYVTGDGVYMIQGSLFNVPDRKNLSEKTLEAVRMSAMKALDSSALLIYPAKGKALHTITVFTDPSCPYCHKLHDEIDKLNELGVTVKYALYARSGNGTLTGRQLQEVLCSKDPKKELDRFFKSSSQNSDGADCKKSEALEKIARLAPKVGLEGTPHIVTDTGLSFSGYRPAEEMLRVLQRSAK